MATNRDVNINIKTKTDAKGLKAAQKEFQRLNKTIEIGDKASKDFRKEAVKLEKTNKKAAKAIHKEADELARLTKEAKKAAAAEKNLEASTGKTTKTLNKATKATGKAEKKTIDLGRSTLLASQGYEDLQFGIGGVLNNIPPLVMALGGTAGLAGVISITAVVAAQMGDVFNTTKGAVKDLSIVIDGINTEKLEDLAISETETDLINKFNDALNNQTAALVANSAAIDNNLTSSIAARKHRLAVAKAEANLELAEIAGDDSLDDVTKASRRHDVKRRINALSGADQVASERERVASLEKGITSAKTGAASAIEEARGLTEGTIGKEKTILRRERSVVTAQETGVKAQESILDFDDSRFDRLFDDTSSNEQAKITAESSKAMGKAVEQFENALEGGNENIIRLALKEISEIAQESQTRRVKLTADEAEAGGPKIGSGITGVAKEINKTGAKARLLLASMDREIVMKEEAQDLQAELDKANERATNLIDEHNDLTERAIKLESERIKAVGQLKETIDVQAIANKTAATLEATEIKNLKKAAAEAKKREAEAKARDRSIEIRDAERELIRGGKEISRRAGLMEGGKADALSQNFRDGLISAIESPSTNKLLKDLRKSAKFRDDEMMKTLVSMIDANNKQAKELMSLKKNAKRSQN